MVGKVLYIKYKEIVDGQIVEKVRYAVDRWQADDKYMGESFITFTVKSSKPIAFSVGDYCEYRGETYTLNYIPSVSQRANIGGSGEAFVYEQVKMDSPREELDRAIMLDVTPTTGDYIAALGTNYTGSAQFQLYCGETTANGRTLTPVCALAAKMQANLDRAFPDKGWKVLVDTTSTHEEAGQQVLNTHSDEKTLTFDNTTIANALAEVKNTFEIDFAVKGRTIYIGYTFGAITGNNDGDYYYFGYGKGYLSEDNQGKALFELKRTSDSGQKIVTRLRALGSTKNMPYRYYNKKYNLSQSLFPMNLQLPDTFETPEVKAKHNKERKAVYPWIRDVLGDTNDAYIDKNDNCLDTVEGLREDCMRWDGTNADLKEIYPSIEEVTYGELRAALCEDQDGNKGSSAFPHYGNNERVDEILDIDTDTNVGDGILTESDSTRQTASDTDVRLSSSETASSLVYMGSGYISKEKEVMNIPSQYAGNYIISNSHLWFRASYSLGRHQTETITKTCKVAYQIKVYAKDLSTNKESVICTYISDYKQISNREAKEYEVEIAKLPDVDAEVQKVDKITVTNPSDIRITFALIVKDIDYSYDQWNVNWNLGLSLYQNPDTDTEWTPSLIWDLEGSASTFMKNPFHVYVKDMGFDFVAAFGTSDTPRIAMKSGMCVAREFEIGNNPQKVEYTKGGITYKAWRLTLAKAEDSSLKTYYPSENFPLAAGDNFVIIGIEMPDVYIQAASMKLLVEATKALADVCDTKHEYEPSVDGIYIQRNYDRCEEEGDVTKSVYWKLGAGMKFPFFGIAEEGKETPDMFSMIIDTLSIREGEGLTPNISIKLSEDFQQSTLQKLTRTVTSITNGSIFKATNIGNGGGLDESSVRAIVSEFTKRRFLSKLNPDTAAGVITFLQGTNWGNFTSETGAAMTVDPNTGQTYMEVDRLKVRLKAFFEKLEIQKVGFVGGKLIVTKGQGVDILDVENIYDSEGNVSAYRCYFLGEQEGRKIDNLLRVKDQMICKDFNVSEGSTDGATNKYYWRLVTAVSSDVVKRGNYVCHWVDLSATDCDTNSDIPEIGDTICHLGNREDTDRQGAEILSVVDANSPSFTIYSGINSYSLVNKEYIDMGVAGGKAFCNIYGSTYIGDRNRENGYISWDYDKEENVWKMRVKGTIDISSQLSSGGTIGGAITDAANAYKGEFDAFTSNVNEVIGGFQAQIDGVIETWFYDPEPTLGNLPASEWKDNTTKDKHLGDLYYSGDGLAYRFQKEGDIYKWVRIDDTAITSALKEAKAAKEAAAAAQGTADTAQTTAESKMKVFVVQPTNNDEYSVGDMWVNATYSDANVSYSNDILKCKEGKAAGAEFKIAHWEKASKYTDDTKANEALTKVDNLQTDVTELGESFDTLTNTTLPALSDGIITTSEKENIRQALMQVQKECVDVINAYTNLTVNYESIYDNIAANVRTDFATAYTNLMGSATLSSDGTITYTSGQGGAYGALVDNINALLNKEGNLTTNEIATINNNIANFNIKYNDFQNRLVVVRNDIEKTLDTRITKVDEQLGGYAYLKKIVGGKTTIDGGLVLTTMLGTGYEVTGGAYKIMSGISGLYETAKSVAIWAGGSMIDKFVYYDAESGKFNVPADVNPANFLVRMDGTGYAAGGNFWWDNDGKIHADPQSFLINEQYVGNVMQLFQLHYKVAGDTAFTNVDYVTPTRMFNGLELSDLGLKIGDTAKFYIKDGVLFLEGDLAVTGGITMYATDGVTSGLLDQVYAILDSSKFEIENGVITIKGDIGDGKVKGATLGGVAVTLSANGILEFDAYPTTLPASDVYAWAKAANKPTYSWGEITDKPSTFTPVAHTHDDRYYTESEIDTKLGLKLDTSLKGVANGLATLDASGKVPSAQLPSYVDDVIEHINKASFPTTGESGKIYIDQTTNLTYRWGGTAYVEISQSLALGETSSTAYAGDKGKQNAADIAALKTGKADKATTLSGYGITDAYTKTEVNTKLTDGSVTKIGTKDVGSATLPIYLKAGVPTAVGTSLAVDITGNSATTSKLKTAVTLWGQSFDGSKAITGNLTNVGTITPTGEDLKVVGNLIVTGGIVMYADDGATIESGFAALLAAHIDGVTIKYNEAQQKIYSVMTGIKVNGATYKPSETDGYITIPDYPTSLDWENIENKPSTFTPASHTHTFASLTSKPTTLSGYGITDAKIANGVITLGTATITPLTAHQTVTLASGTNNGTLKLTVGSKTIDNIAVKGLGSAAYTASSAYAAASHTHSQYLVASSLDGYINALTDNTSTNVFVTAIAKSGKTLSYTKSFTKKSLTAASHSGWSSADTDKLIIPDMSFIAYWNGAYNASGNSNLLYCAKGAFGDMATASKSSYYVKGDIDTKLTDGSVTKLGTGTTGAANTPIYWSNGKPAAVTLVDTANNLINSLTTGTTTPVDADYYIAQYAGGGTTTTTYHRRPHSALYAYIKGKAEGTWAISISGNAATASKLGTANVGSGTQHFYLSGGTATASTSTVGSASKPMYLKAGVMTACSYDFTSYLPLAGGTMAAGARISHADGNMYLGRSDNNGWVMCQDLCSQTAAGDGYWSLRTNGVLHAVSGVFSGNTTVGSLTVGDINVTKSSTGILKIDGNLVVTGGITMYATDGVASGLMEQILVDGTTIGKKADGTLYAINTGNVRSIIMGSTTYTPNDSGAVTLPEKVTWANIEGKPSSFTPSSHTHAISQITNLQATLDGKAAASHTHSYLPLSGGTMSGYIFAPEKGIIFYGSVGATTGAYLTGSSEGVYINGYKYVTLESSSVNYHPRVRLNTVDYPLLSTYNYNSYVPTLTGTGASGTWGISISGNAAMATNADTVDGYHAGAFLIDRGGAYTGLIYDLPCKSIFSGFDLTDAPVAGWVSGLILGSNWNNDHYQHYLVEAGSRWYATRAGSNGKMVNWNTFAYLTDNVASATKLKTARTIWGQSFDGTANIDGILTIANSGSSDPHIIATESKWFHIVSKYKLVLYAGDYNSSQRDAINILSNHNVGIGVDPSYKLHVAGDIYTTTGFKKNGSSDSYVLLGGGGHKAVSDFATSGHTHSYLPLSGGTVTGITTFNINNQWLTPSVLQIGRTDTSKDASKAVIGVTDGNLHIDAYHNKELYLNYYNKGKIRLGYQTGSYYISENGSYYSGTAASASNADTVDGYHASHLLVKRGRLGDYNIDHETTFGTRDIQPSSEITISGKKPFNGWGTLLVIGSIDGASNNQLAFTGSNRMYIRCAYGTSNNYNTNDWATVALTSDNVASASKWQTARKITLSGSVTGSVSIDGSGDVTLATTTNHTHSYLPLAGGTMTGVLTAKANMYEDAYNGALNMANSDIYGLNSIYTADLSDGQAEGIHFYRTSTTVDTFRISNGVMYFAPNRTLGSTATEYTVIHSGNYNSYAPSKTGTGASGTWGISITGNAATASKWATARTITLTGSVTGSVSIDGSGNVSLATTTNHTHSYLPLSGGTMTGTIGVQSNTQNGGLKFNNNNANLNAFNDQHLILGKAIRFGAYNTWDWDVWAGLKYDHANKTIYLGLADGTTFNANSAQSGGSIKFPGVSNLYISEIDDAAGGNGLIAYKPATWTGVSSSQTGVGTITTETVIRSSNSNLKHYKNGVGTYTIWDSGNHGSGSGLNADLLDGVHYLNILEREYTGSKYDSSATTKIGWYRIAECYTYHKNGFLLYLGRNYHSSNNENYIFAITVSYSGNISINQIAGSANTRLITKIRVCWSTTSSNKAYVDFYVGTEAINGYFWYTVGSAKSYGTWGTSPSTSGYNTVEFSTCNGMSSNKDFYISGQIAREGKNGNWVSGRTNAMIRQTTANAYSVFASIKTYTGSWEIGEYTASGERLLFTYVTDTNFNNGNNSYSGQISFESGGNIIASGGITMYSDLRKKNILSDEVLSVKEIAAAPLFKHTYKSDDNGYIHVGTSAQYWSSIHEDWFTRKDSEGYYQMELQNLGVAMGISLAREIVKYESKTDKKIKLMKKKINDLEEANKALDARIKELEERRTA